jgi:catechol 2,3-dioxygenase-like lactoylglutathione lyase family enzyme
VSTPGRLLRGAPYFPVADVAATIGYYREVLGFSVEYTAGQPAEFAIVSRDGCAVMLRRVPDPERIRPMESQGGTWDAFFWVSDAEGLARELTALGASFVYPVTRQPYGTQEFAVRDRDGHVLGFGEESSS